MDFKHSFRWLDIVSDAEHWQWKRYIYICEVQTILQENKKNKNGYKFDIRLNNAREFAN